MTQCVSVYSCFTAKLKSGPRRQFGPRRSPERFWRFHRVIGPIRPYGNTHLHLGRSFGKTGYVVNGNFCCIKSYTRTRIASRPSRAIQLYIAIHRHTSPYIIQLYIAIQYTSSTTPLWEALAVAEAVNPRRSEDFFFCSFFLFAFLSVAFLHTPSCLRTK